MSDQNIFQRNWGMEKNDLFWTELFLNFTLTEFVYIKDEYYLIIIVKFCYHMSYYFTTAIF